MAGLAMSQAPCRFCQCLPNPQPPLRRTGPWRNTEVEQPRKRAGRAKVAQRDPVRHDLASTDAESKKDSYNSASTSTSAHGPSSDGEEFGIELARVVNDVKAGDIRLLHVAELVYWTSYLLIVSVFSKPQLQAALARMQRRGHELGREPSMSASGRSAWEVLDYGDVVVHVLTPDQREFYDLESFYGAAEEIDLPFLTDEPRFEGNWMKSQSM